MSNAFSAANTSLALLAQEIQNAPPPNLLHARARVERAENVTTRDLDLSAFGFQLTARGLHISNAAPTFEQWLGCGEILRTYHGYLTREATIIQFALGDWLVFGERAYGEQYTAAIDSTGYDYGTLRNFKAVAQAVPLSRRNDNLTWSHHQAVAALPAPKQKEFLETAEKEQLSVRALRERTNAENGNPPPPDPMVECPNCHTRFVP